MEILKAHGDVMLIPVSVNLGYDAPTQFETAPGRIRSLIESNLQTESDYMSAVERATLASQFGNLSAPVLARLVSYGIAVLKASKPLHLDITASNFIPTTTRSRSPLTGPEGRGTAKSLCSKARFWLDCQLVAYRSASHSPQFGPIASAAASNEVRPTYIGRPLDIRLEQDVEGQNLF